MVDLSAIARSLVAPPKGILAADESIASADKRLESYGIKGNEKMRRTYRDLLLATKGIEEYLTGVILYEETLSQKDAKDGIPSKKIDHLPFPELLAKRGIIPGIKVDQGTEPMEGSPNELITGGLLGLSKRLAEYRDTHGAKFTKWRAVIKIEGDQLPTATAIVENVKRLASSARCIQEAGMVPILEPEVLYEGTHSRARCREVMEETFHALIRALEEHGVDPTAVILKTSMAMSGKDTKKRDTPEEVAEDTVGALLAAIPAQIPGIVFLSGGQEDEQAIQNLRAIERYAKERRAPWPLTFSYARTLQHNALAAWAGKDENLPAARDAFFARLKEVSAAAGGE
jgi:fructose-bisphosphate aldolase, class I